jgi:aldehyde:ferredoxin oxidoreductase
MATIAEMKDAHKILATFAFTPGGIHRGYADRRLHIDLSTNTITEHKIDSKVKEVLTGGKGFGLWHLWQATKPTTKWDDPENEICFCNAPIMGITQYPGSGKCHVVSLSPMTNVPMDNNVGGYFGSFLKFSGFDLLEVQGKAKKDVVIVIDGNEGTVSIEEAPLESIDTYFLAEELTEMYAKDEKDKRNVSIVSTGTGADHSMIGMLNFSFFDEKRKHTRIKQAGRGGPGTTFRNKKIKAIVVRFAGIGANNNDVANMDLIRQAGSRINKEIITLDATNCRMRSIGTVNMIETLNAADVLPVNNYQYGSDDRIHAIESGVWKNRFTQGMNDGCWFGCTLSCAHAVDNYELKTGPLKGQKVIVDGPEYEGVGGLGSNLGCWDADFVIESNFYCDHYGIDNISCATMIAFIMECYERGIINKEITAGLDIHFGNGAAALELIHQIARGEGFGLVAGLGVHRMKDYFVNHYGADPKFLNDIGMEAKGLEFSEYMTKESLAQQGGFGLANKGPQHDEAWLIFMDQVKKQLPTFADKAEALYYFPLFRTWFSLVGLCKLPWNDTEPADNRTKYQGFEAAKVPEHVENYCLLFEGVTGKSLSKDEMITQSRKVYNFQRIFNLRQGYGTKKDDSIPYRAVGPVTKEEYESRANRYDEQIKTILELDPTDKSTEEKIQLLRTYREKQYESLQEAVYKRRGWDSDGVPTLETIKELGIDFPEIVDTVNKHK